MLHKIRFKKRPLWNFLISYKNNNEGKYIIFGDFNVVRGKSEKSGCQFSQLEADDFNSFINSISIMEVSMGGFAFTRLSSNGAKISKLDIFFIMEGVALVFSNISSIALDNTMSDHKPILLTQTSVDFGPLFFRFFNSWMDEKGFKNVLDLGWSDGNQRQHTKNILHSEIKCLEEKIDQGVANSDDLASRSQAHANLNTLDVEDMKDIAKKSKIKWRIERDENSSYYHGIFNSKRHYLAIGGIKWECEWITDACKIKEILLGQFRAKFSRIDTIPVHSRSLLGLRKVFIIR
nr:RNA-directed DNA polymerase, eukaryota [Tanacetum cinerariifolium]